MILQLEIPVEKEEAVIPPVEGERQFQEIKISQSYSSVG